MAIDQKALLDRFQRAKEARSPFESLYQDAAELILPQRADFSSRATPGAERYSRLFDSTAVWACEMFAAQLAGQLINPALRWLQLRAEDPDLEDDAQVQEWLRAAEERILRVLANPKRKFYPAAHETMLDLGALGTAVTGLQDDLTFIAVPMPAVYLETGADNEVTGLYRCYRLPAGDALRRFGDALGDSLKRQAQANPREVWEFVQAVLRREDVDPTNRRPWVSIHFHEGEGKIVQVGGFDSFPFAVARWTRVAGEGYGRGPGISVLADIRMLQRLKEVIIRGLQKVVDPPLLVPDDGFIGPLSTRPSALNYYRAGMQDKVEPLITGARPEVGEQFVQVVRESILRAFFLDPADMEPPKSHVTATEILDRRDERFRRMTPMLARLQAEWLDPLIKRLLGIMERRGLLPPRPPALDSRAMRVEFVSTAAIAQQVAEVGNLERFLAKIAPMFELDPAASSMIDSAKYIEVVARNMAVPHEVLRSPDEVEEVRAAQAEQQAQAQQAEQGLAISEAMKNLAQASKQQ